MGKFSRVINKLKEPSTWSGFGLLAGLVGISQPIYTAVSVAVMGVCGLVSVVMDEKA